MSRFHSWLILGAVTGALGDDLEAQAAQTFSVQASGTFNWVLDEVFTGLQHGIGAEAQLRYTPGALSVGAGFQFAVHELQDRSEDVRFYGVFIEPRHRIHVGSNVVAPYVSARFSLLKVGFSGGDLSLSSVSMQLDGGGGLLTRLSSRLNLDLGATLGYNWLGEGTLVRASTGTSVPVESSSGSSILVRLGLSIGLRD
jgi:hypothetical protein